MQTQRQKRRYRLRHGHSLRFTVVLIIFFALLQNSGSAPYALPQHIIDFTSQYGAVRSAQEMQPWNLILVNRWHPIPEGYTMELSILEDDCQVDSRIASALQQMLTDMRQAGLIPKISSAYRTAEKQQALLEEKYQAYCNEGYNAQKARQLAEAWVAPPGTSEHELGLAVDITTADSGQQRADLIWQWLADNSYQYGFILRYTAEKQDVTGVIAEPWHYRYVGDAATAIYQSGQCLEEYLTAR